MILLQIYLAPPNLARKRVWNKKYPICIELAKQDNFMSQTLTSKGGTEVEKLVGDGVGEIGEVPGGNEEVKKPYGSPERGGASASGEGILFLFGRTGREKEEWFRRITVASKLKSEARKSQSLPGSRSGELAHYPLDYSSNKHIALWPAPPTNTLPIGLLILQVH